MMFYVKHPKPQDPKSNPSELTYARKKKKSNSSPIWDEQQTNEKKKTNQLRLDENN